MASVNKIAVKAAKIFTETSIECEKYLLIEDDKFAGLAAKDNLPSDITVKDFSNFHILPGLIDTHIHGAVGYDTMDSTPEAVQNIGDYLLSQGTTAWMPTTVTAPLEDIYNSIANIRTCREKSNSARILGMFIEGPYITAKHRGAHPEKYIRALNKDEITAMHSSGVIKSLIIAPEKENAVEFTDWMTGKLNLKVSLGHSSADYAEACACFDAGADASVHTYCAMEQMHHRSPNLLGASLIRDDIYAELIADGIHVSLPAIKILFNCKPKDKVLLVSDAIRGTGLQDGRYMLGTLPFNIKNGIARLDDGNLAGSSTTLLKEVALLIEKVGIKPVDAVNAASLNPAKRFNLDKYIGSIKKGKYADFIIIDENYTVQQTWQNGQCVFSR